jgi:poly-gamma-glutamate synthesis protein (capsule biosynthesis protein)
MNRGTTIRIKAVGDICPGDKYILRLGVLEKTRKYGVEFIFEKVKNELKEGDLVVGNLEGLLTEKVENLGSKNIPLSFCGLPKFADALVSVGFNVINIANNHSFEHGPEIFLETVKLLKKAGISVCGLRDESKEYYSKPIIMKKKGKTLGILGYKWVGVNRFSNSNKYLAESHNSIVNYT